VLCSNDTYRVESSLDYGSTPTSPSCPLNTTNCATTLAATAAECDALKGSDDEDDEEGLTGTESVDGSLTNKCSPVKLGHQMLPTHDMVTTLPRFY